MVNSAPGVSGFSLLDAESGDVLGQVATGSVINLRALPADQFNLRADVTGSVSAVRFGFNGVAGARTDTEADYTVSSSPWTPVVGQHVVTAGAFADSGAITPTGSPLAAFFTVVDEPVQGALEISASALDFGSVAVGQTASRQLTVTHLGAAGDDAISISSVVAAGAGFSDDFNGAGGITLTPGESATVHVTFAPTAAGDAAGTLRIDHDGVATPLTISLTGTGAVASQAMQVTGLALINADTDQPIAPLVAGQTLDLAQLPTRNLNVRADHTADVLSVWFGLDDNPLQIRESHLPFALFSDEEGDYFAWTPPVGSHTITVTPYSQMYAEGIQGEPLAVTFEVVDSNPPPPADGDPPDQIHLSWTQDPATTVTVVWHTDDVAAPSTVEYRPAGQSTWLTATGALRDSGTDGTLHETTITGLTPAASYEYRVRGDDNSASAVYTFRTAPAGNGEIDFIYFADTGLVGRPDGLAAGTQSVIDAMAALNPDFVLPGGDYAYFNTDNERFDDVDEAIDAWFNQMQPLFAQSPAMPTYGNHEVYLEEELSDWLPRFAVPDGIENDSSYSFDVGGVHFVSILTGVRDSQGISNSRLNWVRQDIQAAQARGVKWIIPYTHSNPFGDGYSHSSNTALRAQLAPLFEDLDIHVVLTSHDQSYERTYPLTNAGGDDDDIDTTSRAQTGYGPDDGVVWLKISPAGKLSNKNGDFSRFQHGSPTYPTAFRNDDNHHFSRFIVTPNGTLRMETYAIARNGGTAQVIDTFEYHLGPAAS